jgi:hypothetical protein
MIYEASQIAGADIEMLLAVPQLTRTIVTSIEQLLPLPFGPVELGVDISRYQP